MRVILPPVFWALCVSVCWAVRFILPTRHVRLFRPLLFSSVLQDFFRLFAGNSSAPCLFLWFAGRLFLCCVLATTFIFFRTVCSRFLPVGLILSSVPGYYFTCGTSFPDHPTGLNAVTLRVILLYPFWVVFSFFWLCVLWFGLPWLLAGLFLGVRVFLQYLGLLGGPGFGPAVGFLYFALDLYRLCWLQRLDGTVTLWLLLQ
jgi:hypothetical protein